MPKPTLPPAQPGVYPQPPPVPVHLLPAAPEVDMTALLAEHERKHAPARTVLGSLAPPPNVSIDTPLPRRPFDVPCPICKASVGARCTRTVGKRKPKVRPCYAHTERRAASISGHPEWPLEKLRRYINTRRSMTPEAWARTFGPSTP